MTPAGLEGPPGLDSLAGLWRRSLLALPDGTRDTATRVSWLQGPAAFADLRQPATLPVFAHVHRLSDLSLDDCIAAAAQQGFAGRLRFDGTHYEWQRLIDFQPASPVADAGTLNWQAGTLIEQGRDADYLEHWQLDPASPAPPCVALTLWDPERAMHAILVRVGTHFMLARDRMAPLPALSTLTQCVEAAASLRAARALLDCEISLGSAAAGRWRIEHSTLPFRRGCHLELQPARDALLIGASGAEQVHRWEITAGEGDIASLHITR